MSLRMGAYVFFSLEPLGGFYPPITQTKGPVEREKLVQSSIRSVNLRDCESIFSLFFSPESSLLIGAF